MKIIQILFCGIILATLAIPGWFTMMKPITGQQAKTSPTEKRRLVQFKQIRESWPNIKSTVQTFGQAFDDQLFARTEILQAVNGVLVEQGRHSTSDTILFGEDGYRFLIRRRSEKTFVQIPCAVPGGLDETQRQLTIDNYIAFVNRMATKGVKTRLVIIPTKSSIYPEKLPKQVHPMCVGQIPPAVETINQLQAVGLTARYDLVWFKQQGEHEIFVPQSFHWLQTGARKYAQYVYDKGHTNMPDAPAATYTSKTFHTNIPPDISRHLGITRDKTPIEGAEYFWPKLAITHRSKFKQIASTAEALRGLDPAVLYYARHESNTGANNDPKILMVGDSFSWQLFPYWASSGSEAIFLNNTVASFTPGIFDATVENFGADIVVFVVEESRFAPISADGYPYPFATKLLPPE